MELYKYTESYKIADKTENGWSLDGTANIEANNSISINGSIVSNEGSSFIGSFNFYQEAESDRAQVGYNINIADFDTYVPYITQIIKDIINKLRSDG